MLQSAIDAEVHDFLSMHRDRRDEQGKRLVVGNGQPATNLFTMKIAIRQRPSSASHSVI